MLPSGALSSRLPLFQFRHQLQPDGSLVISSLQAEDAGIYSCGSNGLGSDAQKIQLHVTGVTGPRVGLDGRACARAAPTVEGPKVLPWVSSS